jgi:hypothetical protein
VGTKKGNEHRPVGSEETAHRQPLGKRNPGQVAHTKLRIVGDDDTKKPTLDVAAFNSFIG